MKIIEKQTKKIKGGYSVEKALEKLNIDNVDDLNNQKFSLLNIETTKKDDVEYLKIHVHTEHIVPFSVKVEMTNKLISSLEKCEMYDSVQFVELEACEIKKANQPSSVYYRAKEVKI